MLFFFFSRSAQPCFLPCSLLNYTLLLLLFLQLCLPHRVPSRQSYRAKIDSVRTRTWLDGSRLVEQRIGVLVNENGIVVISAVKDWQLTHVLR